VIGQATATRTYSSGAAGRVRALIAGVVAVPIAAYVIPALLLGEALEIRNSRILIAVCVGILVVGGLWVLAHVLVIGVVTFETDERSVRLRRGGRVRNEWDRSSTWFTSFVERQTMYGVPVGSTRKVFATTESERVEVVCRWFSAATFNDLMADLAPVSAQEAPAAERQSTRTFRLDPSASGLRRTGRSVVIILALVALAGIGVSAYIVAGETYVVESNLVFLGVAALVVPFLVALAFVSSRVRVSRVPASVGVTGSAIEIDQTAHHFAQLRSISLTPPSYSMNSRRLVLVGATGQRTAVSLGMGYGMKSVFPEYDEFVEALGRVAPPGLVRFDLT
jgi:hypothetical protein